jgi:hypothetical protein
VWQLGVFALFALGCALPSVGAAPSVVSNVRAAQRAGTELVDILDDLAAGVPPVAVAVQVSADGGASYAVPPVSLSGDLTLLPGAGKHLVWNAGADWDGQFSAQVKFKIAATDSAALAGGQRSNTPSFTLVHCLRW